MPFTPRAMPSGLSPSSTSPTPIPARSGPAGHTRVRLPRSTPPGRSSTSRPPQGSVPTDTPCRCAPPGHAIAAAADLGAVIERLRAGQRQTLVIGVGHGTCTCEGAAFEYAFNVEHELRHAGVRELADVVYLTNEYDLGDFGVGGMTFTQQGFQTTSKIWTESLFRERGVRAITAGARREGRGGRHPLRAARRHPQHAAPSTSRCCCRRSVARTSRPSTPTATDITDKRVRPQRLHEGRRRLHPEAVRRVAGRADWPSTYQTPAYPNVFGVGIAFAPPHQISQPRTSANGTLIAPAPPTHRDAVRRHGRRPSPRRSPT